MRYLPVLAAVAILGCASGDKPFLGLAEDRARKIEEENPEVDYRLRGITTMTEVRPADYDTYLSLKKEGGIRAEERRGAYVYFAVEDSLDVPFPAGSEGGVVSAWVNVTERYKAKVPESP